MPAWLPLTDYSKVPVSGRRGTKIYFKAQESGPNLTMSPPFSQGPHHFEPQFFDHEGSGVDGSPAEVSLRSEIPQFLPHGLCGLSQEGRSRDHTGW